MKIHREYRFDNPVPFGTCGGSGNDPDRIELLRRTLPNAKNDAGLKL
jgi:hypothetical protein